MGTENNEIACRHRDIDCEMNQDVKTMQLTVTIFDSWGYKKGR
jgi:hypothetical protein